MGSLKRRRSSDHHTVPADLAQQHTQLQSLGASRMTHDLESVPARDQYGTMPVSMTTQSHMTALPHARLPSATMSDRSNAMGITEFSGSIGDYHRNLLHDSTSANGQSVLHSGLNGLQNHMTTGLGYGDSPYNIGASPHSQSGLNAFRISGSPTAGHPNFLGASPTARSPGWFQLPSPSAALYTGLNITSNSQNLRYPVLRPILSRISAIIPISLACDLLELYFESSYSTFIQPASPYVLGFVFRKRSFLRQNNPRPCNPALLASMLWVGAQTSESSFLTSPPSSRGRVCQQLLELTISLLKPLIHTPAESVPSQSTYPVINGVALGGFGVALHAARHDSESGSMGAAGALDDVATYINLASVVSASEYKGASLRWWNAAWSLARELKLGRELPPNPEPPVHADEDTLRGTNPDVDVAMGSRPGLRTQQRTIHKRADAPGTVSEEEREERRRIWWFLYIVDRHLALCYNRPLFLLDAECDSLLQPEDDVIFQSGEYYPSENQQENYFRRRGPSFECTGHSIFGYFLPLMTILGEIVDLNHARNHPRFGVRLRTSPDLDDMQNEICLQLGAYERSLEAFEARYIPADNAHSTHKQQAAAAAKGSAGTGTAGSVADDDKPSPSNQSTCTATGGRITEPILLTKIIVAYGTHLMHTLHILLNGKWDPISLLDDNDLWISSQSFISATSHAVSAAEAISAILDYDPDLSFMPFFFGIYLLQGSFLLLLIADKLQGEASPAVVGACENIVRAHEVCVVTLNTEYQVRIYLFYTFCLLFLLHQVSSSARPLLALFDEFQTTDI